MRLTPAQLGVHEICGEELPMLRRGSLAERIQAGRSMLMRISGKDFGYDLAAWHNHLKNSRDGGYTWGRNIVLPRIMKEALESDDWRKAVAQLEQGIAAIKAAIPHREPFLLIDEIVEHSENNIVCRKRFTGDEFWYAGHYPKFPLTPGVLLVEAAMQTGAVLLAQFAADAPGGVPVATRLNNVKFKTMVRPGDTIEMEVELVERMAGAFFLKAKVTNGGKMAVTFDFACKMAQTV